MAPQTPPTLGAPRRSRGAPRFPPQSLLALVVAASFVAELAQPPAAERVRRIGWLAQVPRSPVPTSVAARLVHRARELGWIEGENVVFEYRQFTTVREAERLAAELVRLNVDVIVAQAPTAIGAARTATATVPIVMMYADDPVEMGVTGNLARPGGNVTGLTVHTGAAGARSVLELVRQVLPRATRLGVFSGPASERVDASLRLAERWIESVAPSLGIHLVNVAAETRDDLDDAFRRLQEERADALLVGSGPFVLEHRRAIMRLARRHRLPAFVADETPVEGALLAFAAETRHIPGRAADYVARILRGARAGDLPIERPTEWRLTIDLRTAKTLGVTVPRALLARAERVID